MRVAGMRAAMGRLRLWFRVVGPSVLVLCGLSCFMSAESGKSSERRFTVFDVPNASYTLPRGINNRGEVTGYFFTEDHSVRGFVRRLGGEMEVFDAIAGGTDTEPVGINERGEVVGTSSSGAIRRPVA